MKKGIDYNKVIRVPEEGLARPDGKKEKIRGDYYLKSRIKRVLIPEICIKKRIRSLAREITNDYSSVKKIYLIPLLKGAFVFAADLGREIFRCGGPEVKIDFYIAETYGTEIKTAGEEKRSVKIIKRPEFIEEIDVLVIDDVGDTVQTLNAIIQDLIKMVGFDVSKIKVCLLLNKILRNPSEEIKKQKNQLKPDYVGFEVPDLWVAGYGIDAGEDFRLVSSIVAVKEDYYLK